MIVNNLLGGNSNCQNNVFQHRYILVLERDSSVAGSVSNKLKHDSVIIDCAERFPLTCASAETTADAHIKGDINIYSPFTLRKSCSALILSGEHGFLRVNRL